MTAVDILIILRLKNLNTEQNREREEKREYVSLIIIDFFKARGRMRCVRGNRARSSRLTELRLLQLHALRFDQQQD